MAFPKGMLPTSWNEVARRNAWTCLSCSARASSQGFVGNSSRSNSSSTHHRRHSSSKPLAPPKNESRTISAPSEAPAEAKAPAVESPKRMSSRLRRKAKDAVREPIPRSHEVRISLPSVPSTQHLHPLGMLAQHYRDPGSDLDSYFSRYTCGILLLDPPTYIRHESCPSAILGF